jgi:hypothetical protein
MMLLLARSVTFLEPIAYLGNEDFVMVYPASAQEANPLMRMNWME